MDPSHKAASLVFRIFLALGCATAAYWVVKAIVTWMRARSGQVNIDFVAETMGSVMFGILLAIALVIFAFLARMLVRRISRTDE